MKCSDRLIGRASSPTAVKMSGYMTVSAAANASATTATPVTKPLTVKVTVSVVQLPTVTTSGYNVRAN